MSATFQMFPDKENFVLIVALGRFTFLILQQGKTPPAP
jgi:hypothetical protein